MAWKRQRDFRAEYQRRIASGLRRGQTRKQARGHAGDLTKSQRAAGAVVVNRGLTEAAVLTKLLQLGGDRRAMVIVNFSDGSHVTLIGKKGGQRPSGARERVRELIHEYGSLEAAAEAARGCSVGPAMVTSINVVYS